MVVYVCVFVGGAAYMKTKQNKKGESESKPTKPMGERLKHGAWEVGCKSEL